MKRGLFSPALLWACLLVAGALLYFVVIRPDIPRRSHWQSYRGDPTFKAAHPWINDEWGAPTDSIKPKEFERLLTYVDSIELWGGMFETEKKLVIRDPIALAELRSLLRVQPPEYTSLCACAGRQEAVLYAGWRRIGTLGLQHNGYVESRLWKSQAIVENPKALIAWLKKYDRPTDYGDFLVDEAKDTSWLFWREGMPVEFQEQDPAFNLAAVVDPEALQRFRDNHPAESSQIRLLLSWYGHGQGGWGAEHDRGYEHSAKGLLMAYSTSEIARALENDDPSSRTLEGAARLFTERSFSKARPGEVRSLPSATKRRLLDHVVSTTATQAFFEEQRQEMARKAFGSTD